jgi:membrane protein DedA with SNARE-associated domain
MAVVVAFASHLLDINSWLGAGISVTVFLTGLLLAGFMLPGEVRIVYQSIVTNRRQQR